MTPIEAASNPFALMMNPESVFAAMARSERLARLNSRVWRPLDKPVVAKTADETVAYDELVDGADEPAD